MSVAGHMKQGERFSAVRLSAAQATDLWERSLDPSAFTRPDYLERLAGRVEWWGATRSGKVVAAWPFVRPGPGGEIGLPPFCCYVGPMFAEFSGAKGKYSRSWASYTYAFSAMVDAVVAEYPRFAFSLPLGTTDIRVLQWWNHDHPGCGGFGIVPRYTARIDLSRFPDDATLLASFASDRRRHVTRWASTPPRVLDDVDTARLVELDHRAVIRTGGVMTTEREIALARMAALVRSGGGAIIGVVPPGASRVEAAMVLLDGPRESNLILCVASDEWRAEGLTKWTVWLGLRRCRSIGRRWFDFNGANSPGRAADKHLYSAEEMLYFNCTFARP
jgi:hypothetical protein